MDEIPISPVDLGGAVHLEQAGGTVLELDGKTFPTGNTLLRSQALFCEVKSCRPLSSSINRSGGSSCRACLRSVQGSGMEGVGLCTIFYPIGQK
jgi:hypothetical protein